MSKLVGVLVACLLVGALAWSQASQPSQPSTQPPQLSGVPETPPKANARLPSGMPVPDFRLQARHRHRFVGRLQFRPDQAGSP